jgi:enterochelin esterase family protein
MPVSYSKWLIRALAALSFAGPAWAQTTSPSAEIAADNRVTFRLYAPEAASVRVSGNWPDGASVAMTKDTRGVWSATAGPLTPELWSYRFLVNGVPTVDPQNNNVLRDGLRVENLLLVPGPESALYENRNVPHGTLAAVWHESPSLGLQRRMLVYTPPGYESSQTRYPVLYLLHGYGGDEGEWAGLGRTVQILDNLIAAGRARPMIVVMPNGHAAERMAPGSGPVEGQTPRPQPAVGPPSAPPARPAASPATAATRGMVLGGTYPESFMTDVVPFVERTYRVAPGSEHRAVAGLSMGGMHTLAISTANPDAFEYIGIFSHAARIDDSVKERLTALRAANPRLVYMAVGLDDFLLENSRALLQQMKDAGLTPMYEETAGAHTWFVWRRYLSDFAPRLFAGPRTIVTTDPELDDSNSLVRFLLYTNEVTTEGLIYASSQFHWRGDGKGTVFSRPNREYSRGGVNLCPCTSWRWQPGERYIDDAVDIYAQVYPNLKAHDPNYPTPEYLESKIREGNVEFEGDMSKDTPGSDLIKAVLLDDKGGPVYLQAWGGQT